jgi:AraC-like DNA-binding protein
MPSHSADDIYRFTTTDAPENQRFNAWAAAISTCDYELSADAPAPFDVEFRAMRFGPFVLVSHQWLRHDHFVSYRAIRTQRKIRADGVDHFYLVLQLAGSSVGERGRSREPADRGALHLFDMSRPFDCMSMAGDMVGLMIRRDLLHSLQPGRCGDLVDSAMGAILAEHLLTLRRNMENLDAGDMPYVMRATNNLLRAGLMRSDDASERGLSQGDLASIGRARQFIDANMLQPDLTPGKISDAIGVSRAKLYQLFQGNGGIMRQVQRQRLDRAYDVLTDPDMPRARISDIAWRHGFADEKYFSRIFRTRFGCMPSEAMNLRWVHRPARNAVEAGTAQYGPTFVQWLKTER